MYFELFRASVQAAQLLQDAQVRAEQQLLDADLPPIRLGQPEKKDEEEPSPSLLRNATSPEGGGKKRNG